MAEGASAKQDAPGPLGCVAGEQARASDPRASAWVSANAGSGKTHVLSQRVIRLLLAGVRPASILCLTYTKAAAAEMSNRVFSRLAEWTGLDDAALAGRIAAIEGRPPAPATLIAARQLFARALETPGGLKIQTIHAFCEALLHQFPLEANVAGHFEVLDDATGAALLEEARRTLLTAATSEEDAGLAAALATVIEVAGEAGLERLLADLTPRRAEIRRFAVASTEAGTEAGTGAGTAAGGMRAALRRAAEVGPNEDRRSVLAALWPLRGLAGERLARYCAAAAADGRATPRKFAGPLAAAAEAETPEERWRILAAGFLKDKDAPRSLRGAVSAAMKPELPDGEAWLGEAQAHIVETAERLRRLAVFEASHAAFVLALRLDADYEAMKRDRGFLDFDDLIERTAALFDRGGAGAWVHYKLDRGIDHILIDEAQDTSPAQWRVVRALAEDFFAGYGQRRERRTLFAVGDEKQSIYSFQGARPERFEAERRDVARRAAAAGLPFESVELHVSFRSTADVLAAVDAVFADPDASRGLGAGRRAVVHESVRQGQPGCVDVWETVCREKVPEPDDWTAPFDAVPESAPAARLAARVAATITDMIGRQTVATREGRVRPVRAGDVLVLVRKRGAFVEALTRALRRGGRVPVAGTDRLRLADHIAVKDLMALGRVMVLPEDDLSLAAVLKSPLFGLDEAALYRLAAERGEDESVFAHLARLAGTGAAPFAAIAARLEALRGLAATLPVFAFYARLLGPMGGRRQFLARLGGEASDVLDEFVGFALAAETASGLPGLAAFLETLSGASPEIKREMDKGRDEVRIMTVHAAKGLEAPVVFLVDSTGAPVHPTHVPALRPRAAGAAADAADAAPFLWVPKSRYETETTQRMKQAVIEAGEAEYRRLLYVAMTRAADRLVVCGYSTGEEPPGHPHWLAMVRAALDGPASAEAHVFTASDGQRWQGVRFRLRAGARQAACGEDGDGAAPSGAVRTDLPAALLTPVAAARGLPRPLTPSGAGTIVDGETEEPAAAGRSPLFGGTAPPAAAGLERGRLVHRLLQVLPGMPPEERRPAAERYLARVLPEAGAAAVALADAVMGILEDRRFAPVFAPGSAAEVSIAGELTLAGRPHAVSGRLDRLCADRKRVLIVDYKTDRSICFEPETIPESYRAQLAIYRALLAPLYPGRPIEAALLYTEAPALVPVPGRLLDAALAAVTAK